MSPAKSSRSTAVRIDPLTWLAARENHERVPPHGSTEKAYGLARMRRLLAALGSPHRSLRVVHVAGTKGKGSTVAMIASVLTEAGYRVGRYMSPHVHSIEERICVDGRPIAASRLADAFGRVIPAVEVMDADARRRGGRGPTWFEVVTAVAMVEFVRSGVDVAVLETGLGGRLDATNVSRPMVSVITSISLDHMRQLGRTAAAIAREKAGIIKRGRPVVSGVAAPSAKRVIRETAARRRCRLLELGRDFHARHAEGPADDGSPIRPGAVEFEAAGSPDSPAMAGRFALGMPGRHQAANAALAIAAVRLLARRGYPVEEAAIRRGLEKVRLPARVEVVDGRPPIVIDAAHNVASMRSLVETVRPAVAARRHGVLLFAASADKQIAEMLAEAAGIFERLVVTRYRTNPRAASIEKLLAAAARAGFRDVVVGRTPYDALETAKRLAGGSGIICVAGSFFLAAELLAATQRRHGRR